MRVKKVTSLKGIKSARAFFDKMRKDESFAEEIEFAKSPEERLKLITDAGFKFTALDLKRAREKMSETEFAALLAKRGGKIAEDDPVPWCNDCDLPMCNGGKWRWTSWEGGIDTGGIQRISK